MSRAESKKDQLTTYHEMMGELFRKFGTLGRHAIVIAHNAVTNRKETTAAFVNQGMSILELLEAGWGIELDIHWDQKSQTLRVCHSTGVGCGSPLPLDDRPFEDVLAKIAAFTKANPKRPVIIDFDMSGLGMMQRGSDQLTAVIEKFSETLLSVFPPKAVSEKRTYYGVWNNFLQCKTDHDYRTLRRAINSELELPIILLERFYYEVAKHMSSIAAETGESKLYREQQLKIISDAEKLFSVYYGCQSLNGERIKTHDAEAELYRLQRDRLAQYESELKATQDHLNLSYGLARDPSFEETYDDIVSASIAKINEFKAKIAEEKKSLLAPVVPLSLETCVAPKEVYDKTCLVPPPVHRYDYDAGAGFSHKASQPIPNADVCKALVKKEVLATSCDTAFGAVLPTPTYTEEAIKRLLQCGVRSFKLDYAQQCDARQLQVDRFNLEQMLRDHPDSPETALIKEVMGLNRELAKTAKYPPPVNSAFLAPLVGKPLADLETLFAAAKYYTGIETGEYGEMVAASEGKYAYHSPATTFLSAAALGALRTAISKVDAPGWRHYTSLGLKAALTATDLYLYSQSAIPLGAALLAATAAEKMGCPQTAVTALKYGVSSLVGMALDPAATVGYTIVNSAAGMLGGLSGATAVNLASSAVGLTSSAVGLVGSTARTIANSTFSAASSLTRALCGRRGKPPAVGLEDVVVEGVDHHTR
jgi:hypothetical protein